MSAVFSLDQVLACTESATSEYSTTSQCLSALLGRSGKVKFITITNAPITPIRLLSGNSSPLVVINTAATRGGEEIHSREGGGTGPQGPIPLFKKNPKKGKIQKPTGEFEGVNTLSSDSGRDIDQVKGARGVVQAGEGRNQIPFCVDEIRHHHFAVD